MVWRPSGAQVRAAYPVRLARNTLAPDPPASRPTNLPGNRPRRVPAFPARFGGEDQHITRPQTPRPALRRAGRVTLLWCRARRRSAPRRSSWVAALVAALGRGLGRGRAGRGVGPVGSGPSTLADGAPGRR